MSKANFPYALRLVWRNRSVVCFLELFVRGVLSLVLLGSDLGSSSNKLLYHYLVVPFELITQLVLLGESSICPGSPWMFHEVFSSPSFFFLFSFLEIFLLWKFFCLFPNFIYLALGWKRPTSSSLAFSFFLSQPFYSFFESWRYMGFLLILDFHS